MFYFRVMTHITEKDAVANKRGIIHFSSQIKVEAVLFKHFLEIVFIGMFNVVDGIIDSFRFQSIIAFYMTERTDVFSCSNLDVLVDVAIEENYIKAEDKARLLKFRDNPSDESWMNKQD